MSLVIINIVDSLARINFGIWNAAISTAPQLEYHHGIHSELWYPAWSAGEIPQVAGAKLLGLENTRLDTLRQALHEFDRAKTIIITHGCWKFPTRWGRAAQKLGYTWIYVPHGMLEPWSMAQKAWKKKLYFQFIEGPAARQAAGVRAVGAPEKVNLRAIFSKVVLIQNGFAPFPVIKSNETKNVLFLGRLHSKKQPALLVKAWLQSTLANRADFQLTIAGPDEGELQAIYLLVKANSAVTNINVIPPVYGRDKDQLLGNSSFFALPSLSEGFPTSVVEAMGAGCVPIISEGCNFPEAFEEELAINSGIDLPTLTEALNSLARIDAEALHIWQNKARHYAVTEFSLEAIARHQAFWYRQLLQPAKTKQNEFENV